MNTMDRYNHPDGDIMSLLAIDLVEGILEVKVAGFKYKTVMQIWQNIGKGQPSVHWRQPASSIRR